MALDDLVGCVVSKIFAAVLRPFVNACHPFVQLLAFWRFEWGFVSFALRLCQVLFFLPEEAGILYRGAIGEIGEGFESHIDAYLTFQRDWKRQTKKVGEFLGQFFIIPLDQP